MKRASRPKTPANTIATPPALVDEKMKRPLMPIVKDGRLDITLEQADILMKSKHTLTAQAILEGAMAGVRGKDADVATNRALQQIHELKSESYIESLLLAQMIKVSNAAGWCMNLAFSEGQHPAAREMNANLAIKFQRTFTAQIEALQKLRGKGGQQVRVEHVHIHKGGQAIVGNVNHGAEGGRGRDGKE